jgi:hypothetical protein
MFINKIYLLIIVIVVILLCKNTIEGLTAYRYDGIITRDIPTDITVCESLTGLTGINFCNVADEECFNDDYSDNKNDGETCIKNNYQGRCYENRCVVLTDEIDRVYQRDLDDQDIIDHIPSNTYYTIKKVDGTGNLNKYTHAPSCSENIEESRICADLMNEGLITSANCRSSPDCCLCNQSKWNKVYTSKSIDTSDNGSSKTFTNIDTIFNIGDKSDYKVVKLDEPNKGNLTNIRPNDNFKRFFDIILYGDNNDNNDKKYTPSKGYLFNQYRTDYDITHEFDINEYPNYIHSSNGQSGGGDLKTILNDDFFYEECLYAKNSAGACVCSNTSILPATLINPGNPRCIECLSGQSKVSGVCVSCSDTNKSVDEYGNCVTCNSLERCNGRYNCMYVKNDAGEGECHQISNQDLSNNDQVIRSDCVPKNPVTGVTVNCNITHYGNMASPTAGAMNDNLYHLSVDTSNTLEQYYEACSIMSSTPRECVVVQSLIDATEGYINYNNVDDNDIINFLSNVPGSSQIDGTYNLITNEYCKSLNEYNCDQMTNCEWDGKCLVKVSNNQISPNIYYIPLPNSHNNELESNNCVHSDNTSCNNDIDCQWINGKCYKNCEIGDQIPTAYQHNTGLSGILSESYFSSNIECKNLSDVVNDVHYSGDPKGLCLDDEIGNNTMYHTGCVDSKALSALILHKSHEYIDNVVTNAYVVDLTNSRISGHQDHLLTNAETCIGYPGTCVIDETSKLIDNCRELCENNTDKCNEYGVKFPTSVDDYSNAGCYLSKYCMSSSEASCIPRPCNTSLSDPYSGCEAQECTAENTPHPGCIPRPCNTSLSDPYSGCEAQECTAENTPHPGCIPRPCNTSLSDPYSGCEAQECTAENTPHPGCLCSDEYDDSGATCTQRDCTDVDQPYVGCTPLSCVGFDSDSDTALPYNGCLCSSEYSSSNCSYTYTLVSDSIGCDGASANIQFQQDSEESCKSECSNNMSTPGGYCDAYQYHPQSKHCNTWSRAPGPAIDLWDLQDGVTCYKKDALR